MKTVSERKKRLGRPPLPARAKKSEHIAIYATAAQRAELEKKHAKDRLSEDESLSEWVLRKLLG